MSTGVHGEWLSLIEISGPFLAVPVLKEVFPQGLEEIGSSKRQRLRQAYEEWREALVTEDPQFPELHAAWVYEVLSQGLELDEDGKSDVLKRGMEIPAGVRVTSTQHGVSLAPDFVVVSTGQGAKALMLIQTYAADIDLEKAITSDGWGASPADRMVELCHLTGCRMGLVTNGERWMFVDAPVGAVTSFASWYARIWSQESITLQAFVHLLGIRRFFFDESEQLPALLDRSLKYQDEVTDALGEQVRRAVEVLIQSLDKADQDRNRELLRDVTPAELYEAGLTVMMRLVFLLSAEERGLLLLGDTRYEANYAVSTLRMQLRAEPEEILERRWDAWSRFLAASRAVFGGIEHESLRLPALGGSLFDPDRFPFLEGRCKGSSWRTDLAKPLPIDNRTVLLLLEAIQQFEGRTLSYRALDVEQIGYVYEGLLERTVTRTKEITLELEATKSAKAPWVNIVELESASLAGKTQLLELLSERMGSSTGRICNDLAKPVEAALAERLLMACQGDMTLRDRVIPYAHLLRTDPWGYPLVYPKGAFIVTTGSDRRETGTHYTPKSLTETIVSETLTPLAYIGPAEGKAPDKWILKSPDELLDLKICDPAMGSGAFLVQACRWLADRMVEAWSQIETAGQFVSIDGEVLNHGSRKEPLPRDGEARTVIARRLIAERCLYGVDLNPLAVELAKLSIWLVTLAKGRPFGFLDHNLRCGDSLLGIHRLEQLTELTMNPGQANTQLRVFGRNIEQAVHEAIAIRQRLRQIPIRDIHDVELMARLDADARNSLVVSERIADAFIGTTLSGDNKSAIEAALASLAIQAERAVEGDQDALNGIFDLANSTLTTDLPDRKAIKRPFHWNLEFPEVFGHQSSGFDAIIGNPPFLGNRLWKSTLGEKLQWQCEMVLGQSPGKIDLCVVFHRRAVDLIKRNGCYGLLATSNIAEGSAIKVGLGMLVLSGDIFFARKGIPWPGKAAVVVAIVCFFKGTWHGKRDVDRHDCERIGPRLKPEVGNVWVPKELRQSILSFEGVNNSQGLAFVITTLSPWFTRLRDEPDSLLRPYITGDDITSSALNRIERWALDILDRPLDEIAQRWPLAHQFLVEEVKPTRTAAALKSYEELIDRWWQFWRPRADLMRRTRQHEYFIGYSKNTKYPIGMLAPSKWIYTNKVVLMPLERDDLYAVSLSSCFRGWLETFCGGNLGATLSLSITESIAKYPTPNDLVPQIGIDAARRFNDVAITFSAERRCGLTDVMNAVHRRDETDSHMMNLRALLVTVDQAVTAAYGWTDIDITYDFQKLPGGPANGPWRWSLNAKTAAELLRRLIEANRKRHAEEIDHGLSSSARAPRMSHIRHANTEALPLHGLDFGGSSAMLRKYQNLCQADISQSILNYLRAHPNWHTKADILTATNLSDGDWNAAICDLLSSRVVERLGEKRGAKYRAINMHSFGD